MAKFLFKSSATIMQLIPNYQELIVGGLNNTLPLQLTPSDFSNFDTDALFLINSNVASSVISSAHIMPSALTEIASPTSYTYRNCVFSIDIKDKDNVIRYSLVALWQDTSTSQGRSDVYLGLWDYGASSYIHQTHYNSAQSSSYPVLSCYVVLQKIGNDDYIGIATTRHTGTFAQAQNITSDVYCNLRVLNDTLSALMPDGYTIDTIEEGTDTFGDYSTEGGYTGGTFDDSSDTIAIPTAPTMGVTSAGFINVYSPTQGELVQFGSELFPDLTFTPVSQGGTPSSVTDALVAMAQVLVDFGNQIPALIDMYINANLIQYVIDCHILPVAPTTTGNAPLKVGFKTFSQTPAKVTSDYVDFDCGTLNVGEYYANFADYAPYTSAKLYLPFVGFMDIAPEYWQSGTLQVIYRFNVIDGSFVAYVKSTSSKSKLSDTVIAQFGGNACVHIPITGLNYASMVSGIVSAVSPLLPSAKANVGTVDKLVNSANTIASAKPTMQQSNGYNATTSFLTVRVPYLLIERSVSNFSRKYDEENGIPSNITLNFANLSGFTKATMLHLDGIAGATEDDLDEIAQLLSEGVIL